MISGIGVWALGLSHRNKQLVLQSADILLLWLAWIGASIIDLGITFPLREQMLVLFIAPFVAIPIFVQSGLYRAVVRYMGLHTLLTIIKVVTIYLFFLAIVEGFILKTSLSPTFFIIHAVLLMLMLGGSRAFAQRCLSLARNVRPAGYFQKRAIVYGAGEAGAQLVAALAHSRELLPVAMVDDDPALMRKKIGALEVYSPNEIPALIERYQVSELLLALPSVPRSRRNEIIAGLESLQIQVRTLPGVAELAEGKVKVADLREAEIEELLGRDPITPNQLLLTKNITDKVVMVTGAGGSIGSELCRQILVQGPSDLILYELSEFALYTVEQSLSASLKTMAPHPQIRLWPTLGSVGDESRLASVIKRFGVQTIYHAAAYKHVPLVEKNPREAIINNIFGTWRVAHAALQGGVETFVLISTDKAVRPTNVMGATKRFAELILQALAQRHPALTRFTMVRFGNVLGSSGSVVPLFREQIKHGGPVTVTDVRVIRYFMTIPEAAQLVIQAGAMGSGGDVFVLDMGDPVKIYDLACRMVHLSGLSEKSDSCPDGDIEIVFTGLRPGEKLYEELLIGENVTDTSHPRIRKASEKMLDLTKVSALLERFAAACAENDSVQLRALLMESVEEYEPQCDNQDLIALP